MRTFVWMGILLLLVFGIGWTTHALADRSDSVEQAQDQGRSPDRSGDRFRGRSSRRGGPYLSTVQHFANEIELSEQQQEQLALLIQETGDEVRRHEKAMAEVIEGTREKVRGLLSEEQRQTLDQVIEAARAASREERLLARVRWFEEKATLSAAQVTQIETILREYEAARSKCFEDAFRRNGDGTADRESFGAGLRELMEQRDARLLEIVPADVVEAYHSDRSRRGGRRSGDSHSRENGR